MNKDDTSKGSWWQTLPGALTGLAGLLTAVGGLLIALNQTGFLASGDKPPATMPAPSSSSSNTAQDQSPAASTAQDSSPRHESNAGAPNSGAPHSGLRYTLAFPAGNEVVLKNYAGEAVYSILSSGVSEKIPGKLALKFSIRLSNRGRVALGFWNDSFRLQVDGVPQTPVSQLNDFVDGQSAKEADVMFEIPDSAQTLALSFDSGQEAGTLPVTLKKSP